MLFFYDLALLGVEDCQMDLDIDELAEKTLIELLRPKTFS